jgi:hypothetical protein
LPLGADNMANLATMCNKDIYIFNLKPGTKLRIYSMDVKMTDIYVGDIVEFKRCRVCGPIHLKCTGCCTNNIEILITHPFMGVIRSCHVLKLELLDGGKIIYEAQS